MNFAIKKISHYFIFLLFIVTIFINSFITSAFAQTSLSAAPVNVSGTVGQYYLSLSGIIAPFASVALLSNNVVLRTTTADTNGSFYISQVLITQGFSSFCLLGIDFKRLGESYKCFSIDPATGNVTLDNIFLPPTLGLQKLQVNEGAEAVAWGYTMRGGKVTLHIDDGRIFTVQADGEGFYEIHIPMPKAGNYSMYAAATYQGRNSLVPDRKTNLLVLSLSQQITNQVKQTGKNFWELLIGSPWLWILLIISILILIFILFKKLRPDLFTFIDKSVSTFEMHVPFIRKKLHHWWFVGY